ncbi:MAG TPA: transposase [Ktedonobacteraceae bacterium]|jgi:hypothetical protein
MQWCGRDWADEHHDARSIDDQGRQRGSIRVAHRPEGLSQRDASLERIAGPGGKEPMACISETTHGRLIAHLLEQGWAVYPVKPRTVERRRAPSGAKTDSSDASLLAKTGRADVPDLRRLNPDREPIQERKTRTRDQDALIPMHTRLVNQLTACLKASSPVALEGCGKRQQTSTLAFLRAYPTVQAARTASVGELTALLKQARYPGARHKAEARANHLPQPCLHASEVMTRTQSRLMLALGDQLEPLLKHSAEDDQEIERLLWIPAESERFPVLAGPGARLAPRRLAERGDDRSRSANASRLQALAGTSPVLFPSGTSHKALRRLGSIKPWRNALPPCSWQRTLQEAWASDSSQRKRAEGKSHTVAVRALATVWARILYAVWKTKEPSQTAIFDRARQAHASRVA